MNKIDILKTGIPNVCFSFSNEIDNKKKNEKFKKQRIKRGFDDTEIWDLRQTFAKFIIPRLKKFKKLNNGFPDDATFKEYNKKIDKIIKTFKMIRDMDVVEQKLMKNKKTYYNKIAKFFNEIQDGLKIFSEIYMDLWW